eukprot:scaffold73_cov252-Pinguiococcus_pyrenoidosus.AAC.9
MSALVGCLKETLRDLAWVAEDSEVGGERKQSDQARNARGEASKQPTHGRTSACVMMMKQLAG